MSQTVKRILNAFIVGFLGSLLTLALASWADITRAVEVGAWSDLWPLLLSVVFGAVLAGLRALQAYVPFVPSPEPEENASKTP